MYGGGGGEVSGWAYEEVGDVNGWLGRWKGE